MKAAEFDRAFDEGEDIEEYVDWGSGTRPNLDQRTVELQLPVWLPNRLERKAQELGGSAQDLVKVWIAEKLA